MYGLDQSFSAKNLKKIFDFERRKGKSLELLFPNIYNTKDINLKIKNYIKEIKEIKKDLKQARESDKKSLKGKIKDIQILIDELKEEKEDIILNILSKTEKEINDKDFVIEIEEEKHKVSGKDIYKIKENNHTYYLALKKIQYNLGKIYKVKQANRNIVIDSLKVLLNEKVPKKIIKIDIKDFYESINFNLLINKLKKDGRLDFLTIKFLLNIQEKYEKLGLPRGLGKKSGLPRGLGISAYLSEIYMEEIDQKIKEMEGVYFYVRYVDDIIILTTLNDINYLENIKKEFSKKELNFNNEKTEVYDTDIQSESEKNIEFDYLGYNFNFTISKRNGSLKYGNLKLGLSRKKIDRYKRKIDLVFENYKIHNLSEKKAKNLFLKRIRFLTYNTYLLGRKKFVKIGIKYSNNFITEKKGLSELDKYLEEKTNELNSDYLKKYLSKISFNDGFDNEKLFKVKNNNYKFKNHNGDEIKPSENQFKKITKIWTYV